MGSGPLLGTTQHSVIGSESKPEWVLYSGETEAEWGEVTCPGLAATLHSGSPTTCPLRGTLRLSSQTSEWHCDSPWGDGAHHNRLQTASSTNLTWNDAQSLISPNVYLTRHDWLHLRAGSHMTHLPTLTDHPMAVYLQWPRGAGDHKDRDSLAEVEVSLLCALPPTERKSRPSSCRSPHTPATRTRPRPPSRSCSVRYNMRLVPSKPVFSCVRSGRNLVAAQPQMTPS